MPRTIQKRLKFSKGELNPQLDERTDLNILDSSASYIKNYVSTIYGGFKTRLGTRLIEKVDFFGEIKNIGATTSIVSSFEDNLFKADNVSANDSVAINYDNKFIEYYTITNAKIGFKEAIIEFSFEKEDPEIEEYKVVANIINAGYGYVNPTISGVDSQSIILNMDGSISSITTGITTDIDSVAFFRGDILKVKLNIDGNELEINNRGGEGESININISREVNNINISIDNNCNDLSFIISAFSESIEQQGNIRVFPFVFNDEEKFLILLGNKEINIIQNDMLIERIVFTSDLYINNLSNLKYTQSGNTIIFTESSIVPKELNRDGDVWTFKNLELINVPFNDFNNEEEQVITNITLTPQAEEGTTYLTSNINLFNEESLGQIIDGNGGRFRITKYENAKKVFGYTIIPFYTKDSFTNFKYITGYEPVWSETRGFPNCCLFYQQRLWFGGSKSRPLDVWGSRINQFNDFNNIGNYDNDSIDITINSKENNEIVNLYGNRGLQIFTGGAEFVVNEGNLTPNTISVIQTSSVGSLKIAEPLDIAGTTIFLDKSGNNINSFIYSNTVESYVSQSITLLNNHILNKPQTFCIDFNSSFENGNFIYVINDNGEIALANILLEQDINSFTRMITKNGKFKDCIALLDDVYLIVERNNRVFLEKVDLLKTDFTIKKEVNSNIIDGLEDYEGLDVRIYSDLNDYGVYNVVNGEILLEDIVNDNVFIGIDIDCELISNDISVNQNTNNIKSRISKAVISTDNTKIINLNNNNSKSSNNIFNILSVSGWDVNNKFTIKSTFDNLNIKSIVLYINYGR